MWQPGPESFTGSSKKLVGDVGDCSGGFSCRRVKKKSIQREGALCRTNQEGGKRLWEVETIKVQPRTSEWTPNCIPHLPWIFLFSLCGWGFSTHTWDGCQSHTRADPVISSCHSLSVTLFSSAVTASPFYPLILFLGHFSRMFFSDFFICPQKWTWCFPRQMALTQEPCHKKQIEIFWAHLLPDRKTLQPRQDKRDQSH